MDEARRRLLRRPPVAGEDVRAAHLELAVDDAGGDPRQRHSHRARPARPGVEVREVHPGFGHTVALEDLVAGELAEGGEGLGRERRAAGAEEAHGGKIQALLPLAPGAELLDQPAVHGGDTEKKRGLAGQQTGSRLGRVEAAAQAHGGPGGEGAVEPHHQAVGVEERQREEQGVRRLPGPGGEEAGYRGEHVVVRDLGPLALARRARGVEEHGEIAPFDERRIEFHGPLRQLVHLFGQQHHARAEG